MNYCFQDILLIISCCFCIHYQSSLQYYYKFLYQFFSLIKILTSATEIWTTAIPMLPALIRMDLFIACAMSDIWGMVSVVQVMYSSHQLTVGEFFESFCCDTYHMSERATNYFFSKPFALQDFLIL